MRKSFLLIAVLLTAGDCLLTAAEMNSYGRIGERGLGGEFLVLSSISFIPNADDEGTKIDSALGFQDSDLAYITERLNI
jgi:hypothetical protein